MVQITKAFPALLSLSTVALASVGQIKTDLADISTKVTNLNTSITNYPTTGGTLSGALVIHTGTEALIASIKTATTDVAATASFSVADGTTILQSVQAAKPVIVSALSGIVAKKAAFVALPLGGVPKLIYQDLDFLNGNATLFANGLIKNCPASLVPQATTVKNAIASALSSAISAYATFA